MNYKKEMHKTSHLTRTALSSTVLSKAKLFALYSLLFTLCSFYAKAQTLPVNAQLVVTPPYANSLNDYGTGSNLMLNLLLRDMNTPMLEVYFAIELEGSAIKLKTSPAFRPSTYADLSPGVTSTLSNSDLMEYFDLKNLELEGMSKSDFAANSSLFPEGLYKFKIQAFSRNTGFAVSNTAQALMGIFKGQAPFINLPFNKGVVRVNDLQNFSIQWTNRNSASFSASNSTGYKLEMWEMLDPSQDPNIIVNSAYPPILSHYTALTTYLYGPSDYTLVPGKRYALRVQALDADGRDIYQNSGYSQVSSFTYGEACMTPTDVKAVASLDQILFTWTGTAGTGGFQVRYQMANGAFEEKTVYMNKYILKPVVPNAEYLFQVATLCDGGRASDYSIPISTRSQPTVNNNQAKCGDPLPKVDLKNTKLIPELKLGDVFKAYDFEIKVTRIDNNDNTKYAGEGTTRVKMLGNLNIVVNFKDVKINTDYQMLEGRVDLQQEPYVLSDESVKDFLDDAQETKKRATGNDDANADNITVDAVIGSVTYNETTKQIEVKDASGTVIKKLTAGKNYSIKDKDGNQYLVSEDNKITKVPPKGATATSKGTAPKIQGGENTDMSFGDNQPIITFAPASDQVYAFDTKELKTNSESQYEYIVGPNKSYYYVPCKSIAAAGTDKVVAKLQVNPTAVDLSKIKFKDHEGKMYNAAANSTNTEWTVDLVGALHGHDYALFPYYTDAAGIEVLCGKLNVFSFDQFTVNIKFIPLKGHQPTGFDKTNLQSYLNKVYQQANIVFELSVEESFDTTTTSLSVDHGKLVDYSAVQVDLINTYIAKNGEAADNTLYLFMCKETSSSNVKGHTPVNRSYGFLFGNADDRTIAHEIAHGYPLALEHPFSDIGHSTDYNNLLSYNTSTSLSFKQWLLAHNPPLKIRFGKPSTDGEHGTIPSIDLEKLFTAIANIPKGGSMSYSPSIYSMYEFQARDRKIAWPPRFVYNGVSYSVFVDWNSKVTGSINGDAIVKQDGTLGISIDFFDIKEPSKLVLHVRADNIDEAKAVLGKCGQGTALPNLTAALQAQFIKQVLAQDFNNAAKTAALMSVKDFNVSLTDRLLYIKKVLSAWDQYIESTKTSDGEEEAVLLYLTSSVPAGDINAFHQKLSNENVSIGGTSHTLLEAMYKVFDDLNMVSSDNHKYTFTNTIITQCLKDPKQQANVAKLKANYESKPSKFLFVYRENAFYNLKEKKLESYLSLGKLYINASYTFDTYNHFQEEYKPLDDWIVFMSARDNKEFGFEHYKAYLMPSLLMYHLVSENDNKSTKDAIYLTADLASFAIGIGELKAGATGIRYGLTAADLVLTGAGIGGKVLEQALKDNGFTDQELATFEKALTALQVATSGVLEGPQVLNTFKTCGSFVNKLANVIAHPKNISPETLTWLKKLENAVRLASGVQKAINFVAAKLGVSKTINFTGFNFKADGFTDIIIHSRGGKFVAIVEGVQVEKSIDELASIIDQTVTGKPVRILSCNDESSALALSLQTQKPFYASDGWVEITKTGEVFAENDFYQFSKGQKVNTNSGSTSGYTKANASGVEGVDFVRLGEKLQGAGNWTTLEIKLVSKLSSSIDASTLNTMIVRMKNAGEDGLMLANRIVKGTYESVEGYVKLIKNSSVDNQTIKSVNQALDKADDLVAAGTNKSLLRFEDNPSGYDVDLGIRTAPNANTYSEVYQFKTNTAPLSKSSISEASKQLYQAPANNRIIEFRLSETDNISLIKNNEVIKKEFTFQLYDKGLKGTNNIVINEFYLISSNGEKIKVVYTNGGLQFINF